MSDPQPNNPLHGITLKVILEDLVQRRGWSDLASEIEIRCFMFDPTIASSLRFLRRTPWARAKVEALYLDDHFVAPDDAAALEHCEAPPELSQDA